MYKLLIVDDDEIICRGLRTCIAWEEHEIFVVGMAYDGETALEYVETEMPDIILVDINMPFIDGMEFSNIVRQRFPEIKIILLTAYKEFAYARQAVQLQIFEYLTKPFANEEVLETVLRAVNVLQRERQYQPKSGIKLKTIREKNPEEQILYGTEKQEMLEEIQQTDVEKRVHQALEYIRENYSNPELRLEDVAKEVNLSASYLGNCMKKYRQISYVNFLNQIRIENAKKLLRKPDTRSYEVAFLVGFNSSQYFSSCFKKYTGYTPGEYRERVLKRS